MEPNRNSPQDLTPHQPGTRPAHPMRPRPVMSDFAPRPHSTHTPPQPQHTQPATPHHTPAGPAHAPVPRQVAPPSIGASSASLLAPPPEDIVPKDLDDDMSPAAESAQHKEHSSTAHAGLVGFVLFVVLTAIALSPFLPGKILENFPGSSQSFSTGDQTIGCAGTLSSVKTTQTYNTKNGFPLAYTYSTTSTIQASCAGKSQTATGGHTSQFNPLGAAADVAGALVIAAVFAKLWGKLLGSNLS